MQLNAIICCSACPGEKLCTKMCFWHFKMFFIESQNKKLKLKLKYETNCVPIVPWTPAQFYMYQEAPVEPYLPLIKQWRGYSRALTSHGEVTETQAFTCEVQSDLSISSQCLNSALFLKSSDAKILTKRESKGVKFILIFQEVPRCMKRIFLDHLL